MTSLPESICSFLSEDSFRLDETGKSGSQVLLFSDKVLKIQPVQPEIRQEVSLLDWLQGRLPVPRVLAYEQQNGLSYLLMTKLPGDMACAEAYMQNPQLQADLLACALKALWQVDITGCPVDQRLPRKLAAARHRVEQGLVDMEDTQPDTFSEGGFRDPAHLLHWLQEHQPEEDLVLSHGDFCLPNILFQGSRRFGLIDWGRGGIGGRWNDIALCYRSLHENFSGLYTGVPTPGYDDSLLFRALGLEPDWEKIRYYILLDELF